MSVFNQSKTVQHPNAACFKCFSLFVFGFVFFFCIKLHFPVIVYCPMGGIFSCSMPHLACGVIFLAEHLSERLQRCLTFSLCLQLASVPQKKMVVPQALGRGQLQDRDESLSCSPPKPAWQCRNARPWLDELIEAHMF